MKSLIPGACAAFLLLSLGAHAADEKGYVLATGELPPAGTVLEQKTTLEIRGSFSSKAAKAEPATGVMTSKRAATWKISILAPDKYLEELSDRQSSGEVEIEETKQPLPSKSPGPLLKSPVMVQKSGDDWVAKAQDGSDLPADQAADWAGNYSSLSKMLAVQRGIYGKEPRKPGDRWRVDSSTLPQYAGIQHPAGFIECEFVEVKELESGPAAVIRMKANLNGASLFEGQGSEAHMERFEAEITELRSIPYQITLDQKVTGTMALVLNSHIGAPDMKISGPFSATETFTIVKKP